MSSSVIDYNRWRRNEGGKGMFIGDKLRERMSYFEISKQELSEEALIDIVELDKILNNEISFDEIDEITLAFISQVLYCNPEYFIDESARCKDLVNACFNRGNSTPKSNKVKGLLQKFTEDLAFLCEVRGN